MKKVYYNTLIMDIIILLTIGFVLNNDKTRSLCVHQWDRFREELRPFVDSKLYDESI